MGGGHRAQGLRRGKRGANRKEATGREEGSKEGNRVGAGVGLHREGQCQACGTHGPDFGREWSTRYEMVSDHIGAGEQGCVKESVEQKEAAAPGVLRQARGHAMSGAPWRDATERLGLDL